MIAGFIASMSTAEKVFAALAGMMALTIVCTAFGGKLLDWSKANGLKKVGSTFLILSLVLTVFLITMKTLGLAGANNTSFMCIVLVIMTLFLILDVQLILNGYYNTGNEADYTFASMKLFADCVLIFGLLIQLSK